MHQVDDIGSPALGRRGHRTVSGIALPTEPTEGAVGGLS